MTGGEPGRDTRALLLAALESLGAGSRPTSRARRGKVTDRELVREALEVAGEPLRQREIALLVEALEGRLLKPERFGPLIRDETALSRAPLFARALRPDGSAARGFLVCKAWPLAHRIVLSDHDRLRRSRVLVRIAAAAQARVELAPLALQLAAEISGSRATTTDALRAAQQMIERDGRSDAEQRVGAVRRCLELNID